MYLFSQGAVFYARIKWTLRKKSKKVIIMTSMCVEELHGEGPIYYIWFAVTPCVSCQIELVF